MSKILKYIKIFFWIVYVLLVLFVIIKSNYLTLVYNLPDWFFQAFYLINFIFIVYKFVIARIRKANNEKNLLLIINHTFRTPLTNIIWLVNELEKNIPQNERINYLQKMNNSASKVIGILDIVAGIKDINNTSNYFFEAVSIREIIEESIKKNRDAVNKKRITFQVSISRNIPLLTIDLKKISFVIDTIIENAVNYTKQDGKIIIDCSSDTEKIKILVNDTGIGLTFVDKLMIFSKFYRGERAKRMNTDGVGLRLYLSKSIIKNHKGNLYFKSNGKDTGTSFFVELPFLK